jgi:hypothetical protein
MTERVERRRDKRFGVASGAHVMFGPHLSKVGEVMDISGSGLSFRYIGYQDSSESTELGVLSDCFCFLKVPFETVFDFEVTDQLFLGSIPVRRRGVRFRNLTPDHRSKLRRFMQDCTVGETDA